MQNETLLNKIIHGDCLEEMKHIESGSIDMVLTDPPYNISRANNFKTMGRSGIDFGEWDKGFDLTSYFPELYRVTKKGANVVVFTDWKELTTLVRGAESVGFEIKDMIRLEKSNPMPRNRDRRFIVDYEVAIWCVKKGSWTFNRQSDKYDRPLFKTSVTPKSEKRLGCHPTQKPLEAIEGILYTLSNKGDVVLDSFIGSGTTAIAAINTGRNFIGIEKEWEYYEIANKRIEEAKKVDVE